MHSARELVESYVGGLAHVHSRAGNRPGRASSDQSVKQMVKTSVEAGLLGHPSSALKFVMFNDHVPARPARLALAAGAGRRHEIVSGVTVLHGYEAGVHLDGSIDLPASLAEQTRLVIGVLHDGAPGAGREAGAAQAALERACKNPLVDVIGHPTRQLEGVSGIDWAALFKVAAGSGTAIEVSAAAYPDERYEPARTAFWARWLRALEHSEADVFFGTGIHTKWERERFVQDWQMLDDGRAYNQLAACVKAMAVAGIGPARVVTADERRLMVWLRLDKRERGHLVRAKLATMVS